MDGKQRGKKRSQEEVEKVSSGKKKREDPENETKSEEEEDEINPEDIFEDEFIEEDEEEEGDEGDEGEEGMEVEDEEEGKKEAPTGPTDWKAYTDRSELPPGTKMEYDSSAYVMFHSMSVEWPCLSFDVIPDKLGMQRAKFPMTTYLVTGTQAEDANDNKMILLKMTNLHRTEKDDNDSEEDSDSDDDDLDEDPELEMKSIPHPGGVNRIRCMPQEPHIVATWSDRGFVALWNVSKHLKALDEPPAAKLKPLAPLHKNTHKNEGYALDWSSLYAGRLIAGDCNNKIFLTEPLDQNASGFKQNAQAFSGHTQSVEDLQWSPTEDSVFASCSVDGTVKIWDIRDQKHAAAKSWEAGTSDINVISWGRKVAYLLVSGSDDGSVRVWDLRSLRQATSTCLSVANFTWHKKPITSVSWDPNDESSLAVCSEDDSLTVWDLSTEKDEEENKQEDLADIPSQLLFIHQNQSDMKELRYHPQIPGVIISTSLDGFDIFKPSITVTEDHTQ